MLYSRYRGRVRPGPKKTGLRHSLPCPAAAGHRYTFMWRVDVAAMCITVPPRRGYPDRRMCGSPLNAAITVELRGHAQERQPGNANFEGAHCGVSRTKGSVLVSQR